MILGTLWMLRVLRWQSKTLLARAQCLHCQRESGTATMDSDAMQKMMNA